MYEAAIWWLTVEALALAALPASTHLFKNLPDKGYGFAKPIGIILSAYVFWLLATLGILDNARVTIASVVVVIALIAWVGLGEGRRRSLQLWREQPKLIILTELLFALAFVAWCLVRSYNPQIAATEKPMEIAFLNGVLRSSQFPPVDPWLSGYSISYYYFGYVMVAMLAKLSDVQASIAFNLAIALLFAMTVVGAFSLAYNLAAGSQRRGMTSYQQDPHSNPLPAPILRAVENVSGPGGEGTSELSLPKGDQRTPIACGLFGALFVAVMGNLEGLLEIFYSHNMLPQSFWTWLNIQNLDTPYLSQLWYPTEWYWWFKASRVIADFDPISKVARDYTINEFPSFSFLLGDLHPHVLALPFTFVAMGLALSMLKSAEAFNEDKPLNWRSLLQRKPMDYVLWGIVFGGLGFINSWDMPTYLALFVLAFALKARTKTSNWLEETIAFGIAMLAISIVLYIPFYLGFSSQVKGLGFVLQRTKLQQFVVFWGPFLFFVIAFLLSRLGQGDAPPLNDHNPSALSSIRRAKESVIKIAFVAVIAVALIAFQAATLAVLLPLIFVAYELLFNRRERTADSEARFVTLLILVGTALLFVCELFFVRDFFGNRMNTVFKVYYQVWQMLAVASAYVVYCFLSRKSSGTIGKAFKAGSLAAFGIAVLLMIGAFVYPVAATITKTGDGFGKPVLDGRAFMAESQRADYDAITWLNQNVTGTPVVLEASGGSYSQFGRISAFTGLPTVVGWDGHELQWRGTGDEASKRKSEVEAIYQTYDDQLARLLLKKYNVTYVYVGSVERDAYGKAGALDKFAHFGNVVYQNTGVTIYKVGLD